MKLVPTPIYRGLTEIRPILEAIGNLGYIAGGYARYCCSPNPDPAPAGDVDIYLYSPDSESAVLGKLRSAGFTVHRVNPVSYSLNYSGRIPSVPRVQLIRPITKNPGAIVSYGSYASVLGSFDFTVARVALLGSDPSWSTVSAICDSEFEDDEQCRVLHVRNIHCPISTAARIAKYVAKGYSVRSREVHKLFLDWNMRGESYHNKVAYYMSITEPGFTSRGLSPQEVEDLHYLLYRD